jgi:hypothetical protein
MRGRKFAFKLDPGFASKINPPQSANLWARLVLFCHPLLLRCGVLEAVAGIAGSIEVAVMG